LRKLSRIDGKLRLNRKAVSAVIAVLLMIAIAVAAAILVYVWSMGLIGTLQTGGGQQVREQVIMDAYKWPSTGGLTLFLRNVGSSTVNIAAVYVQGIGVMTGATTIIPVLTMVTVSLPTSASALSLSAGVAYTIKIVTIDGAVFTFSCVYGGGS